MTKNQGNHFSKISTITYSSFYARHRREICRSHVPAMGRLADTPQPDYVVRKRCFRSLIVDFTRISQASVLGWLHWVVTLHFPPRLAPKCNVAGSVVWRSFEREDKHICAGQHNHEREINKARLVSGKRTKRESLETIEKDHIIR